MNNDNTRKYLLAANIPVFFGFPLGLIFFLAKDEQSVNIKENCCVKGDYFLRFQ